MQIRMFFLNRILLTLLSLFLFTYWSSCTKPVGRECEPCDCLVGFECDRGFCVRPGHKAVDICAGAKADRESGSFLDASLTEKDEPQKDQFKKQNEVAPSSPDEFFKDNKEKGFSDRSSFSDQTTSFEQQMDESKTKSDQTRPFVDEFKTKEEKTIDKGKCECAPNTTVSKPCGNGYGCGANQKYRCDSTCRWVKIGGCSSVGVCQKGTSKEDVAGSCGSNGCGKKKSLCSNSCQWASNGCTSDGICKKGDKRKCSVKLCEKQVYQACNNSCQWSGSCATTNNGWKGFGGGCYRMMSGKKKHALAVADCVAHGGFLTGLCGDGERIWVHNNFGSPGFLVDGFKHGSKWKWGRECGGKEIQSVFWKSGEPSGDGTCVELWGGKLNDVNCSLSHHYVCEVRGKPKKFP